MSTGTTQTPVKGSGKARSQDSHKTKKRKHVNDHEEPGTEKKKEHKKSRVENNTSLPAPETPVKKSKKRLRSPPAPTGHLTPTSPADIDIPNSAPALLDHHAPQTQTLIDERTTPQRSPSPSILDDTTPSPFHSVRLSLYLPLSAISLSPSTALSSLQAEHLSPLLLTYYAPIRGIVLAFTDTSLSSTRPNPSSPPDATSQIQTSTAVLAHCADDYGASYTWLTTTFLVFRPTPGETLSGWINVASDGFVGLISYNYFQSGVAKTRIPKDWRWVGPGGDATQARKRSKTKKIRIRSLSDSDDDPMDVDDTQTTLVPAEDWAEDDYDGTGYFVTADGSRVNGKLQFRIVDADVVPGHDRDKWSLQIEGTLLSPEDEAALLEEERVQAEKSKARGKPAAKGASMSANAALMSGGLGAEDRRRTVSVSQTPVPSSARR
jgi:DNA-directed RNA polymerase I subunit RPA43